MNKPPQTALSHPLVIAYLNDLDRALSSADPQERLDTIAAVSEHLTEALGDTTASSTEQVQMVLDELGAVERIALAATPAAVTLSGQAHGGRWTAPVILAASIVALVLLPFTVWLAVPLAFGCLVTAGLRLRGAAPGRQLLRAAAAVSVVTLLSAATMAATLLASSQSTTPSTPVVESVTSQQ